MAAVSCDDKAIVGRRLTRPLDGSQSAHDSTTARRLRQIKPPSGGPFHNRATSLQSAPMTYRSLLTLLDDDPQCPARSAFAIRLARSLGCHLTGLAPTGLLSLPAGAAPLHTLMELATLAWRGLQDAAQDRVARFAAECRKAGCRRATPWSRKPTRRHRWCATRIATTWWC
jgi:hypothetical protein